MYEKHYPISLKTLLFALLTLFFLPLGAQGNLCFLTDGGMLTTPEGSTIVRVCLDDGDEGLTEIIRTGFSGGTSRYFVTTPAGFILEILDGNPPFDLRDYPAGPIAITSIAYTGNLSNFVLGENICTITSDDCISFSNPLIINRQEGEGCDIFCFAEAGELALTDGGGTSTERCIIDGVADPVAVSLTGDPEGDFMTYLITNDEGEILAIPEGDGPFDLSAAGAGTCLIWYLSYDEGLEGLAVGNNADDFDGCFSLSNPITVVRNTVGRGVLALADGGGTELTTCAGDGVSDAFNVTLTDTSGANFTYVITDGMGTVLGLADNQPFDLEGAGGGACNIYALTSADNFGGIAAGDQLENLTGCFALSNPITVTRNTGDDCDDFAFQANLSGLNEAPCPVTSTGSGMMTATLTGRILTVSGSFSGLTSDFDPNVAGGAHIHLGMAGSNGGIAFLLTSTLDDDLRGGTFPAEDNQFELTDEQIDILRQRGLYVNIHTLDFGGGELRGQLVPSGADAYKVAYLLGVNEVPAVVTTAGGAVIVERDGNEITVSGSFSGLMGTIATQIAGGAHLHIGIAGRNGGVAFPLSMNINDDMDGATFSADDNVFTLDDDQLAALAGDMFYVNVHSSAVLSGEIRGQLTDMSVSQFYANPSGHQERPVSVNTPGNGRLVLNLAGNTLTVSGSVNDLLAPVNTMIAGGSHIHIGLPGQSGGIVFGLNITLDDNLLGGVWLPENNQFELTEEQLTELYGREYYVNVHSEDFNSGEVRGQVMHLAKGYFGTNMAGINANPNAVKSTGQGFFLFDWCGGKLTGLGSIDELSTDFDASVAGGSHIHFGDAASTGGIAFPLTVDIADDLRGGEYLPAANTFMVDENGQNALLSGGLYVNIHTTGSPSGEIRGQILRDDNAFPTAPEIITPADGAIVQVFEGGNDLEDGIFNASSDPDGDLLVYTIEITSPEDTEFASIIACSKVGTDTLSNATIDAVYDTLIANGAMVGISVPLRYRVVGSDGSVATPGGSRTIVLMITDPPCTVEGGTLALADGGTEFTICAGDGVADPFNVVLTDTVSSDSFTYLVVSDAGIILGVPADQPFDFDGAGGGACTLYAVSHDGSLTGAMAGEAFADLDGCFALSNPVVVTRNVGNDCEGCDVEGGMLTLIDGSTTDTICAGDGMADPFGVILTDTSGAEFTYIVVSAEGMILGVPANQPFDFDGAGGGACTLYAVSHDSTLTGAVTGNAFADLTGCFDLSNPVVVTRLTGDDCDNISCNVEGGTLTLTDSTTAMTICANDGVADPFNVILADTFGAEFTYLVVSDAGVILGAPANQPFDFDGAGGGACTLYAVSHDGTLAGAEQGAAFADLSGCFDLSNPVVVTRNTGNDCEGCDVEGGILSLIDGGTTMRICAGDGTPDPFNVVLNDTVGAEFTYLVVSDQGVILGTPADQPFDFDGAGGGACTLYAVSHDGTLSGAVQDALFANLEGCFDLSNPVVVTRLTGDDCEELACGVDGGILTLTEGGTEMTICAGDSIPDPFTVTLTDTVGTDFTYIVVSDQGIILGTPADQPFDFDGAGGGACTLYAVSHNGSLRGDSTGLAFTGLSGCFELSNPIVVTRLTGDECTGGLIAINEVDRRGMVELENISEAPVNVSSLFLASNEEVVLISTLDIECGSYFLKPNDRVTLDFSDYIDASGDELALLFNQDYTSARHLLAYVAWGESNRMGETMAEDLGIWTMGTNPGFPNSAASLQRIPNLVVPTYALGAPTLCAPNQLSTSTSQPAADQIAVFPNPFSEQLTLEVSGVRSERTELQIFDINGRLIISRQLQLADGRIDLPTGQLTAGAYLLRLTNDAGASVIRVIKR
ncbi:CHRD domain-containing protein [Neolewinella persica]|uniref:CHRD domain-containing protein n=1 Tax=Neolewinella persica TaxID=70998 RepID=UPI00035EFAD5|nr:CHRD domain-containing protein [Neolewinella persica]